MWNFGLDKVKLGIRTSMKEYAEWYDGGDSEISRKMELNQGKMICGGARSYVLSTGNGLNDL